MTKVYYTYIATNKRNTVLYTGVTNNLKRRMREHKRKTKKGFTSRYNIDKLVFFQAFNNPTDAIAMEKKIKGWLRIKKIVLIEKNNPDFDDLLKNTRSFGSDKTSKPQDDVFKRF